ncbi:MAG: hypothetical protein CVT80_17125 [Alphaproteobacteria bacterium HGW-Alphaproteobacteria-2]|nr:MAG: hypothetical protein CVT80_17125 [Alphaproteobacteria bacterium HGW-Alphaproteobacteria-2]
MSLPCWPTRPRHRQSRSPRGWRQCWCSPPPSARRPRGTPSPSTTRRAGGPRRCAPWGPEPVLGGKRILAVVPARGGSKGVPLKNIHPLRGRPLIAHTAGLIAGLPWIDRAVVSTDHERIAEVAEAHGLPAPFRRPEALSGDRIGDVPVLAHALEEMERRDGVLYDVVVMLQPTSPLRREADVEATVRLLVEEGRDAVWTVSPTDLKYHPRKQLTLGRKQRRGGDRRRHDDLDRHAGRFRCRGRHHGNARSCPGPGRAQPCGGYRRRAGDHRSRQRLHALAAHAREHRPRERPV